MMEIAIGVVTNVIVICGWFVTNSLQKRNIARQERLRKKEQLNDLLNELEELAIKFHTSSTYNVELSHKINRIIKTLWNEINAVIEPTERTERLVSETRQAITLNNFDKSTFTTLKFEDQTIKNITDSIDELKLHINQIVQF